MLYNESRIKELNDLKHHNDSDENFIDYETNLLEKNISPYIYNNNTMNNFLKRCNHLVSKFFDNVNIIKNFKNFNVDKYYYKHKR